MTVWLAEEKSQLRLLMAFELPLDIINLECASVVRIHADTIPSQGRCGSKFDLDLYSSIHQTQRVTESATKLRTNMQVSEEMDKESLCDVPM